MEGSQENNEPLPLLSYEFQKRRPPFLTRFDLNLKGKDYDFYIENKQFIVEVYTHLKARGAEYSYGVFDDLSFIEFVKFVISFSSIQ